LVDAWEIENEPDIDFVPDNPESYAAFLKASYLGFHSNPPNFRSRRFESFVLMGALALPPGPYLEALIRNDAFRYTDGLNYHYYGYASDFAAVYGQFQAVFPEALKTPSADPLSLIVPSRRLGRPASRKLPVFVTEYGYGSMSSRAAATTSGRIQQWRWFRDVGTEIQQVAIDVPIAFYLPSYLENGIQEFGLVMPTTNESALAGKQDGGSYSTSAPHSATFSAGALKFHPADFGRSVVEPWMTLIGLPTGKEEISPALAWLITESNKSASIRIERQLPETPPSAIVLDFIPGFQLTALKQCQGYFLENSSNHVSEGEGNVRLYNLGTTSVSGHLHLGRPIDPSSASSDLLTIGPGEMKIIPIKLRMPAVNLEPTVWQVIFKPANTKALPSTLSTMLYPSFRHLSRVVAVDLSRTKAGENSRQSLRLRAFAHDEPTEETRGRWSITKGVKVLEHDGVWDFSVIGYPDEPLRPAIAELALPDDFRLPDYSLLELEYRLAARNSTQIAISGEPRSPVGIASLDREMMGIYWRTANGNLYTVWQPLVCGPSWLRYAQMKESFTGAFYGRANLPWRFNANRPVALVFTFKPNFLPAVFQVRKPSIVTYGTVASKRDSLP
jgi:hypothetical protein